MTAAFCFRNRVWPASGQHAVFPRLTGPARKSNKKSNKQKNDAWLGQRATRLRGVASFSHRPPGRFPKWLKFPILLAMAVTFRNGRNFFVLNRLGSELHHSTHLNELRRFRIPPAPSKVTCTPRCLLQDGISHLQFEMHIGPDFPEN